MDEKLSDGEVLDLIYDFCEAQVMSHPILEKIIIYYFCAKLMKSQ